MKVSSTNVRVINRNDNHNQNYSQHWQDDNTFIQNEENVQDVDDEPIILEQVHDDITDIEVFETHIRDIEEASHSLEKDVDVGLEADEGEEDPTGMFVQPSTMMT
ncbi:hypothetical protein RHMOL_Rhmol10G0187900 [Rhododendron molle]|uniref:Uncharacterized protein n=1 Tax=Rhododendron molle TaxID=49168 RepID=A0ACC0M3S7_RHOML|nr:hypothetical protein RHMOL_Rhmol10G0187900 [Rhododendron molle]